MAAFTMRPHTFVVKRNLGADTVPPTASLSTISSGACNNQVAPSGGMGNISEALDYDYVLFHDETEEILVEDLITVDHFGKIINGTVMKALSGQLSNRIWYNEISS